MFDRRLLLFLFKISSWGRKQRLCFEFLRFSLENQRQLWTCERRKFLSFISRIFCGAATVTFEKAARVCFLSSDKQRKGTAASGVTEQTSLWLGLLSNQRHNIVNLLILLCFHAFAVCSPPLNLSLSVCLSHAFKYRPAVWLVSANQLDLRLTQTLSDWPSEHIVGPAAGCSITVTIAVVSFSGQNWPGLFVMAKLGLSALADQTQRDDFTTALASLSHSRSDFIWQASSIQINLIILLKKAAPFLSFSRQSATASCDRSSSCYSPSVLITCHIKGNFRSHIHPDSRKGRVLSFNTFKLWPNFVTQSFKGCELLKADSEAITLLAL